MKEFNKIWPLGKFRHFFSQNRKAMLLICFLLFVFILNISAQPNPISVDTRSLYQYGTNSSGSDADENTDSVSLGSTTYYFYMPDVVTNTGFAYTDLFAGVTDSYTWTVPLALAPAGAEVVAAHPTAEHYKQITWGGTGLGNIQVDIESSAGCTNSYTAPVRVIDLPTVQYIITDSSFCLPSGTDGSLAYSLNNIRTNFSSVVNGNKALKVDITISCTNPGFGPIKTYTNISVTQTAAGRATFNMPINLNYYGLYTITLTAINDRISSKCGKNGTVGASSTYNFVLSKVPSQLPFYHIKNE